MKNLLVATLLLSFSSSLFALGNGITSTPMALHQQFVSAEGVATFGDLESLGLGARYTRKVEDRIILDGGASLSGGDRTVSFFAGTDFEFYPDFENQPKISLKTTYQFERLNKLTHNVFTVAPTVTKSLDFWGTVGYPYASLPLSMNLVPKYNSYITQIAFAAGVSAYLPIPNIEHVMSSLELQVDLKDSFSALILSLSYELK